MSEINEFQGKNRFLSNFYISKMVCFTSHNPLAVPYDSAEHYYQAFKAKTLEDHMKIISMRTPGKAKRMGSKIELRHDWEDVKIEIMKKALKLKFADNKLRTLLLNTKDCKLIEGNNWGDTYWGVDLKTGKGKNMLGILLMELRETIYSNRNQI